MGDDRRRAPPSGRPAPTRRRLLDGGVDAAGRKVTEEATEVLLAAKDDAAAEAAGADRERDPRGPGRRDRPTSLYHALVLLAERGLPPADGHRRRCASATALSPTAGRAARRHDRAGRADLAPALADPDVEPLPGDRLRDGRRVRDPLAVDRHAAAGDHPARLAARREHAGLGQQDRGAPAASHAGSNVEPARRRVQRREHRRIVDRLGRELRLASRRSPGAAASRRGSGP